MSAEQWVEVELTVTDQANQKATRHIEFKAMDPKPERAVGEVVTAIHRQVGPGRIHAAGTDRSMEEPRQD